MKSLSRLVPCLAIFALTACAELAIDPQPAPRTTGQVLMRSASADTTANAASRRSITASEARQMAVANNYTGYRALPPGIQRNLARGKRLPPGLARRMAPDGMLPGLPSVDGHEWLVAGQDLVLVALGTQIVVEVLSNVFQ